MNYNQSSQSRSSTVSMTGSSGENSDLSWSVYGGYERYRNSNSDSSAPTTFGGNLQQNTRFGALRANYDQGDNYRQEGLGASGTTVLHHGGLTAGPYTSDTFALIHADGAQGAIVQNGGALWLIALVTPFCLRYLLTASITLRSIPVRCAAMPN